MSTLYLIATPIGNLEDLSRRAERILREVPALACEDTRVTRVLLDRYAIPKPGTVFSYHEHNEAQGGRRIVGLLDAGTDVALCTDGGYPGISDPGYRIIAECVEKGRELEVIPGPSAAPVALLLSGLPTSSFTFKGFPPRKEGARRRFLDMDKELPHTLVFYESPFRVGALLASAREVYGNRMAAVCLELTKKFQRVARGPLDELASRFKDEKIRGEATIVIAGNHPKFTCGEDDGGDEDDEDTARC